MCAHARNSRTADREVVSGGIRRLRVRGRRPAFRLLLENRRLLSQREVLGGEFGMFCKEAPNQGGHDLKHAHLTAPAGGGNNQMNVSGPSDASTRKSLRQSRLRIFREAQVVGEAELMP